MTHIQTFVRFFATIACIIFQNYSIAADYVTTLNNELAAIGLNNGTWLYNSETDNTEISSNNQCDPCTITPIPGKLTYFDNAYRVNTQFLPTARPWDAHIKIFKNNLNVGDKLLLVFWTKGDPSAMVNSGGFQVYSKKTTESLAFIPMSDDWEQWRIPFETPDDTVDIELRFGYLSQQFEIGGVALIKYDNATNIEAARTDASQGYEGIQANASWRTEALNRINTVRKSDMNIVVKDENGNPIPSATVSVKQQAHQFDFGATEIGKLMFTNDDDVSQAVAEETKSLILQSCNTLVLGSDLLWERYINPRPYNVTKANLSKIVSWAQTNNLRFRWHNTLWPATKRNGDALYIPKNISDIISLQKNKAAFLSEAYTFIDEIMQHPNDLGNLITEIDVVNEPAFNRFIENNLGYDEAINVYRDVAIYLKENYPTKKLYINDFVVLDAGGYNNIGNNRLKEIITEVNNLNGLNQKIIDAMGFQMHIKYAVPPETIKELLDSYADTNSNANDLVDELKITEFDLKGVHPAIRAQYFEDFLIMVFSHPKVNGFVFWDSIKDRSWADFATPLYKTDGTLKDSGIRYQNLVFNDWWTNVTEQTDVCGFVSIPAFKGKQQIVVSYGNENKTDTIDLNEDKNIEIVLNQNVQDICVDDDPCNVIKNGNFTNSNNYWSDYINSTATANWNTNSGQVNYYITNGSNSDWEVQLLQTDLNFQQNKTYLIQFDAKADVTKTIFCRLSTNDGFVEYVKHQIEIGNNWQTYSFYFTMPPPTITNGRISFGIGGNNTNINFDNIMMQPIDCGYDCEELVSNGAFLNNLNYFDLLLYDGGDADWYHNDWGKYASIKIQNGRDKRWKVQLAQRGVHLKNNTTYRLTFKAKADAYKTIFVSLTNNAGINDYTQAEYFDISDEWDNYEFIFTMNKPEDHNARLNFAVGTNEIAIRFDDVSLLEVDCFQQDCYQNLVHFGAIKEGIYQADEFIQSSGEIDDNAPTVEYRANDIQLKNGFSIPTNTSFKAFINECE